MSKKVQDWFKQPYEMKTSKWAITYWLTNGRTVDELNAMTQVMPSNWKLEGQIEQGHDSQNELHAQLMLHTEQTRGTKIQKYFQNCHISEADNPFALQKYVHKQDTRVAEFKTVENRSPQWRVVRDKFYDWLITVDDYAHTYEHEIDKYRLWDQFIGQSLEEGMEVDLIGVNPQYRSCINKYWINGINMARSRVATPVDKKTDKTNVEIPTLAGGGTLKVKKVKKLVVPIE